MKVVVTCECGHVTEPDAHEALHEPTHTSAEVVEVEAIRFCSQCGRSLAGAVPRLSTPTVESPVNSLVDLPSRPRTFQQLWQSRLSEAEENRLNQSGEKSVDAAAQQTKRPAESPVETLTGSIDSEAEAASSGRRSLWAVMGNVGDVSQQTEDRLSTQPLPSTASPLASGLAPKTDAPTAASSAEPSKPKGLWSVMSASEPAIASKQRIAAEQQITVKHQIAPEQRATDDKLKPAPAATPELSLVSPVRPVSHEATISPLRAAIQQASIQQGTTSPARSALLALKQLSAGPVDDDDDIESEWCGLALTALALGIAAVLLAALSLKPGWLVRLPSLVVGVIALMIGFTAIGDVRRARGQLKGRLAAIAGVVLGALGMLLAPLLFARMGDSRRENAGREVIVNRLRQIGTALDQHHTQYGHFPSAVIYSKRLDAKQPLHGWMTSLLPFLGHEPVHRRIDLAQPFDAPANVAAMQQIIPEFLVPNRKPVRSPRGFGLTHFAGVGGETVNEQVGLMHLGVFAEEGAVRREQITDGLAQTIIVGEIADPLPAWGEPGNMRSIGNGLNKQFHGFGNPTGTGATFLHGDGSVKFYSNKTDRRLLQQLETRDGGN